MKLKLVITMVFHEEAERSCLFYLSGSSSLETKDHRMYQLQKAIAKKLQTLVIIPHALSGMLLLLAVLMGVIGIFRYGFESQVKLEVNSEQFAQFPCVEVGINTGDDGRKYHSHACEATWDLEIGVSRFRNSRPSR